MALGFSGLYLDPLLETSPEHFQTLAVFAT